MRNPLTDINVLANYIDDLQLMIQLRQSNSARRLELLRKEGCSRLMMLKNIYWAHDTADLYDRLRFYENEALKQVDISEVTKILTKA